MQTHKQEQRLRIKEIWRRRQKNSFAKGKKMPSTLGYGGLCGFLCRACNRLPLISDANQKLSVNRRCLHEQMIKNKHPPNYNYLALFTLSHLLLISLRMRRGIMQFQH
jgi:hypothetical protein